MARPRCSAPGSRPNIANNFAGATLPCPPGPITVVEFYNAALDHYFISPLAPDIDALDTGHFAGWARTGLRSRRIRPRRPVVPASIRSAGSTFRRSMAIRTSSPRRPRSAQRVAKILNRPQLQRLFYETPNAFYIGCRTTERALAPRAPSPGLSLWNKRADSNHRYTTDRTIKTEMMGEGIRRRGLRTWRRQHVRERTRTARPVIRGVCGLSSLGCGPRWRKNHLRAGR